MVTPERPGTHVNMVRDLLKEGGKEWDIELVKGLFLPQDMDAILSIPMSDLVAKDRLVWVEDKKGRFTVSSTYKLAREIEVEDHNASYSDLTEMQGVWRGVWSMNMPNKSSIFLGRPAMVFCPLKILFLEERS